MYKNIIFDIGNVLLEFNPKEFLSSKIPEADKVLEVHKEVFESEEWLMLDRGTITEEDAKKVLINRSSNNAHLIPVAFENWYDILIPIEGTVKVLKLLKAANYKVYFLSNFHRLAFKNINERYDFFKLFNGGVVSYEEKLLKPEQGIYARLIEKYELKPEECIFIDDVQANIEGAKKVNFKTILFKNPKDLVEKLKGSQVYID